MDQEAFFTSPLDGLLTMHDIAQRLHVPLEAVKAVIERQHIAHTSRHGVVRLWSAEAMAEIQQRLHNRLSP